MTGTQVFLLASYTVLMVASAVFVTRVVRSTRARARRAGTDVERLKERENRYAWVVVGVLIALLAVTAFAIPYSDTEASDGQEVDVVAFQFGWTLKPATVQADEAVQFNLRGRDVQHGFGIYDGAKLLGQVQVPAPRPGAGDGALGPEQRFVYTFSEPGEYKILCLEFCGRNHHKMAATLTVEE